MAKTTRISGNLKIALSYNDRTSQYKAKVCTIKGRKECETVFVGHPRHLTRAVDSPKSYTEAAQAAVAFARPSLQEQAEPGRQRGKVQESWGVRFPRRKAHKPLGSASRDAKVNAALVRELVLPVGFHWFEVNYHGHTSRVVAKDVAQARRVWFKRYGLSFTDEPLKIKRLGR